MEKAKVYYCDMHTGRMNLPEKLKFLMKKAGFEEIDFKNKYTAIKVHFGEPGNLAFLRPNYAKAVADYVKETNNHVLYRVTPIYDGDNLVAKGVQMEAQSVEDDGEGIMFNVFVYNVQPGIKIDYKTGDSELNQDDNTTSQTSQNSKNTETN